MAARGGVKKKAKKAPARKPVAAKRERGRGRPTDYLPAYCEQVIEHAKQTGHSLTAFAGTIGVCRDTLTEWAAKRPDFSLAMRAAKAARTAFLEGVADKTTSAPQMNYRLLALKNCGDADWREAKDVNIGGQKDGVPVQTETVAKINMTATEAYLHMVKAGGHA